MLIICKQNSIKIGNFASTPIVDRMDALLYEYEQDLEDLLSYWLQQENFSLTVAETRKDFFRSCREASPQLLILGTCPPNVLQEDVVKKIRKITEVDEGHLLILTTSTKYFKKVQSKKARNTTAVCTPTTPKLLKKALKKIRRELEKPAND